MIHFRGTYDDGRHTGYLSVSTDVHKSVFILRIRSKPLLCSFFRNGEHNSLPNLKYLPSYFTNVVVLNVKHEVLPPIVFHPIWHQVNCTWMMYVPLGGWILRLRLKAEVASHQIVFGSSIFLCVLSWNCHRMHYGHKLPLHRSFSIIQNRLSLFTLFSINFSDILECSIRVMRFVACGEIIVRDMCSVFRLSLSMTFYPSRAHRSQALWQFYYLLISSVTGSVPTPGPNAKTFKCCSPVCKWRR